MNSRTTMKLKVLIRKIICKYFLPKAQIIYSQSGEDLILSHLFSKLGIKNPRYLDIGANEPKYISNTYRFYEQGSRGVLIEPNPYLFLKLKKKRSEDIVLNVGVGLTNEAEADFFLFPNSANGLSTFSKKDAMYWQEVGLKGIGKIHFEKVIKVCLLPVNNILQQYFTGSNKKVNLISIDVEGLDFAILKSIDFNQFRPEVICIETLQYDENQNEFKNRDVLEFMLGIEYMMYADTRVNTIFCRKDAFIKIS